MAMNAVELDRRCIDHTQTTAMNRGRYVISRQALVNQILHRDSPHLCIVHAPAGYGKSSLLAELQTALNARRCRIVTSLNHVASTSANGLPGPPTGGGSRYFVLLDDDGSLSEMREQEIAGLIEEQVRCGARVVVATRISRWAEFLAIHFGGNVTTLAHHCLAFTDDDVRCLFGSKLTAEQAARIMLATRGWPLGVRLLHLDFAQAARPQDWTMDLDKLSDRLGGFFDQEVMAGVTAAESEFLIDLAQLSSIEPAVVAELLQEAEAHSRIAALSARGFFLQKVARHKSAYALHPLFRAHLLRKTVRVAGLVAQGAEFHRRASECYARNSSTLAALSHALQSGDLHLEAQLIERLGGIRILFANGQRAASYFHALPDSMCGQYPMALLGKLYMMIQESRGELAADLFDKFTAAGFFDSDRKVALYERIVGLGIELNRGNPLTLEELSQAEREFAHELRADWVAQGTLYTLAAAGHFRNGHFAAAILCADKALQATVNEDVPLLRFYASLHGASAKLHRGDSEAAHIQVLQTREAARQALGDECSQVRMCATLLGRLCVERLDYLGAASHLAAAGMIVEERPGWFEGVEAELEVQTALRLAKGGPDPAVAYLEKAAANFVRDGLALNAILADLLKVRVLIRSGKLARAEQTLLGNSLGRVAGNLENLQGELLQLRLEWALYRIQIQILRDPYAIELDSIDTLQPALAECRDAFLTLRYQGLRVSWLNSRDRWDEAVRAAAAMLREAIQANALRRVGDEWNWLKPIVAAAIEVGLLSDAEVRILAIFDKVPRIEPETVKPLVKLGAREWQVLRFLADGLSSKEMANRLQISIGTVKSYRRSLYTKLNIATRSAAVEFAKAH